MSRSGTTTLSHRYLSDAPTRWWSSRWNRHIASSKTPWGALPGRSRFRIETGTPGPCGCSAISVTEAAFLFDHRLNRLPLADPLAISRVRGLVRHIDGSLPDDRVRAPPRSARPPEPHQEERGLSVAGPLTSAARAVSPRHRRWKRLLHGLTLDPAQLSRPVRPRGKGTSSSADRRGPVPRCSPRCCTNRRGSSRSWSHGMACGLRPIRSSLRSARRCATPAGCGAGSSTLIDWRAIRRSCGGRRDRPFPSRWRMGISSA